MDRSLYKDFQTSRGITYHYYASPAQGGKPYLLFAHGFPQTSYSWHHQVKFFKERGYGIIVPDQLGYGGTDKPTDPHEYRLKLLTQDMMEVLDHEKVTEVVAVGHDWGSALVSRIANYHQNDSRFIGFGFMALSYMAPSPDFDIDAFVEITKALGGGDETFGYWSFFSEDNAAQVIEAHPESFFTLFFTNDATLVAKHVGATDALKKWVHEDMRSETAAWFTEEEKKMHIDPILAGGLAGPLCWYKTFVRQITPKDDSMIPKDDWVIKKPVFFGAALKDVICTPAIGKIMHNQYCPNTTIVEIDESHWVLNALPEKCNDELLKWIQTLS